MDKALKSSYAFPYLAQELLMQWLEVYKDSGSSQLNNIIRQ